MNVDDMTGAHAPDRPSYWGNHSIAVPRDLVADIIEVLCGVARRAAVVLPVSLRS